MENDLQFDRAEFSTATARHCSACQALLNEAYFQADGSVLCGTCADEVRGQLAGKGTRAARFGRAALYGFGAAVLGAILYYAVLAITGYQIGFVAIVVGILVGKAVRTGSGGRGGWRYQVLAVLLTYSSIAATFMPGALHELREHKPEHAARVSSEPAGDSSRALAEPEVRTSTLLEEKSSPVQFVIALAMLTAFALALPVLVGMNSPITLLIIGFGIWEAFRLNKRTSLAITGPHAITPAAGA